MGYAARAMDDIPAAVRSFAEAADRARGSGLITLALEADVNRAQLLAEAGDLTTAFDTRPSRARGVLRDRFPGE